MWSYRKISRKIQFSKRIVRCIIKAVKEGDIFEYNGADKYRGNDEVGKLMYDFSCTNPVDMNYETLAKRARYFKQDEKGVATMCKIMEDMRNEAVQNKAKKTAVHLIKLGKMSLEEIAEATELSLDTVKELENQTIQLA